MHEERIVRSSVMNVLLKGIQFISSVRFLSVMAPTLITSAVPGRFLLLSDVVKDHRVPLLLLVVLL